MAFVTGDVVPSPGGEEPFKVVFKQGETVIAEWPVGTKEEGEEEILEAIKGLVEERRLGRRRIQRLHDRAESHARVDQDAAVASCIAELRSKPERVRCCAPPRHPLRHAAALIGGRARASVPPKAEDSMHRKTLAALALLAAMAGTAAAQEWPTRPITLVVPFTAGGGIDVSARIQALQMGELLGQIDRGRQCRRRGRHRRQPARRQGRARRLHHADRQYRHPRLQPVALQAAALQLGHRIPAGRPGFGVAADPVGPQGSAGQQPAGVHRLCEGQPGEACSSARPASAPARIFPACCSISRSGSTSPTCPIAAPAR